VFDHSSTGATQAMDARSISAARANEAVYDSGWTEKFVEGAPHLKHASVRAVFDRLLRQLYDRAMQESVAPHFLDIGAGEGSITCCLLELGARVTAIDVSSSQLAELERKCRPHADRLQIRRGDIDESLLQLDPTFDAAIASASLHHIPNYFSVIRLAVRLLHPHGQFLSFQDPLRYDTVGRFTRVFDELSYFSWRVFQGDLWGGFQRRLRRYRHGLDDNSVLDNAEYHVLRNGVDQEAILNLLLSAGFECELVSYFSTQSRAFQPLGEALGIANTFAIIARRRS
jgi:SAM-dependent methyltransferase